MGTGSIGAVRHRPGDRLREPLGEIGTGSVGDWARYREPLSEIAWAPGTGSVEIGAPGTGSVEEIGTGSMDIELKMGTGS